MIDGQTLISWGYNPGPWFRDAIESANGMASEGASVVDILVMLDNKKPQPRLRMRNGQTCASIAYMIDDDPDPAAKANLKSVREAMRIISRLPTVVSGAVMPDACPAGQSPGTIPVGGVVATKNAIHPGMHSADICCSMAITMFSNDADPSRVLDAGMKLSHFGWGGRAKPIDPAEDLLRRIGDNKFLTQYVTQAREHHATQGDGNHFFYVGRLKSTGALCLVTHHGSRGLGASLYKRGMAAAIKNTAKLADAIPVHNAWLTADSAEGQEYWAALQLVREWTKSNHMAIHGLVAQEVGLKARDFFWNEHNFVFQKSDGLFYHGKGATPAWKDFAADSSGCTLIPMNMAEPILITEGLNRMDALGFAPHGAGRNMSRSAYLRSLPSGVTTEDVLRQETAGLDVRFFCGEPDVSELPGAYKSAESVRDQIDGYELAEVVDTVEPCGSIMAGDLTAHVPWRKKSKVTGASTLP